MKGQKESVIETIKQVKSTFNVGVDNALLVLTSSELDTVKNIIETGIIMGTIEYSKDRTNRSEVRTYARSMVMNHIKKAKELNGNMVYKTVTSGDKKITTTVRQTKTLAPKGVNVSILPDYMKEYTAELVKKV